MRLNAAVTRGLVAVLLLYSLIGGWPLSLQAFHASAHSADLHSSGAGQKMSDDLLDLTNRASKEGGEKGSSKESDKDDDKGSSKIPVIIQSKEPASRALMNAFTSEGGSVKNIFQHVGAVAVDLPKTALSAVASRGDVVYISLDRPTEVTGHLEATTGANLVRNYGTLTTGTINGTGIGIAVLDSGIYGAHHSFGSRVAASVDFTGEGRTDDPYGHGTHVAGVAAGNYHVANGAYTGVAPVAKLINVRVLDSQGRGSVSSALAGIEWCIANKALYNIRVMNLSFGSSAVDSYVNDPLCLAVRRAFAAGIVVCVAAGNLGKDLSGNKIYGAIHSPGTEPAAITVGASNTFGTTSRSDDAVASFSSRGPTRAYRNDWYGRRKYDNIIKPDLVAPGNKIIAAMSPNNYLSTSNPSLNVHVSVLPEHKMMKMSGTSMATPAVAGAAALILQRNPSLNPNLVKLVLEYTAQPLAGFNTAEQGAGQLNVEGAVRLAGLIRPDLNRILGASLLTGSVPAQSTTVSGVSFNWSGGIIQKWNFIKGVNLITKYQGIYGDAVLLTDGVLLSEGVMLCDGVLITDGVLLSEGVILSDGTLNVDGVMLADGAILADGCILADGTILADGVLISDSFLALALPPGASSLLALSALTGEGTSSMPEEVDYALD